MMAQSVNIPEHLKKKHMEKPDPNKRKGWATPYGFIDFTKPVTYEVALAEMEKLKEYTDKLLNNQTITGEK
jgi:hypothetical protein